MKKALLFIFFEVCFALYCTGQDHQLYFTYLTSGNGLSSDNVYAIQKDRHGFVWFGTEDGLNKFDGVNFTVYRNIPGDVNSLPANEITCLYVDQQDQVWIGTNGGGVSMFDRIQNKFRNFAGDGSRHCPSSKAITSISGDKKGRIWVGTFGGLDIYNPETGDIERYKGAPTSSKSLKTNTVLNIFRDKSDQMWVGTSLGLYLFNESTHTFRQFLHVVDDPGSLNNNTIQGITEDAYGHIWIGTENGLNEWIAEKQSFRHWNLEPMQRQTPSINRIFAMAADSEGWVWVGSENGLFLLNPKSGRVNKCLPNRRDKHGLSSLSIRSLFLDQEHINWVGTFQGGVNKEDRNLTLFNWNVSEGFDSFGLQAPVVTAFAANRHTIYVATDGGGLHSFDRKSGLMHPLHIQPQVKKDTGALSILALQESRNHHLLVGTYNKGVYILNDDNRLIKQLKKGYTEYDLNNNDVFCLLEDRQGQIWIGTNGGGLNIYNPKTGLIKKITNDSTAHNISQLTNDNIRALAQDRSGNIWVATYGAGICVFTTNGVPFKFFSKDRGNISSNVVLSLFIDHKGRVWAGTLGGGLILFEPGRYHVSSFTSANGLANNVIQSIVEDAYGYIWVSTNQGISRFDPEKHTFKNFSTANGLQTGAFVHGAGWRAANGEIYFGGIKGFNFLAPANLVINKNIPPVVLTGLTIAGKSVTPALEGSPLTKDISVAKAITLDYKQTFTVSFVALGYTLPQQNQYKYKLYGFEKEWNTTTKLIATYTNLDPGEYVFAVKAANNDGIWNKEPTTIRVIIRPPFWRTIYAYIFYFMAAGACLLILRHRGIRKLKRNFAQQQEKLLAAKQLEQEQKESEQLRALDRMKIKFLTNLSHDFRTPISLIIAPAEKLLNKCNEKENRTQIQMISRNARRLMNLVNQLLDFRKMEEQGLKLNQTPGEAIAFIREVFEAFTDLAEIKQISYHFNTEIEILHTNFDHDKMERILFNLLSNAFKFTYEKGEISIYVNKLPEMSSDLTVWLEIMVSDTGIGIPPERQENIFERFFQADVYPAPFQQGNGLGLAITKEFISMSGGSIKVKSEPNMGSTFTLWIPFEILPPLDAEKVQEKHQTENTTWIENITPVHSSDQEKYALPLLLLIDDNYDFRFYLRDNLKAHYQIIEASNGKEGWQKALSSHPQLIVCDINMPEMDGITLCRKIKADERTNQIPLILLTANVGEENQLIALETGANDYVTKPFNSEILQAKIKNLLLLRETFKNTYSRQLIFKPQNLQIENDDMKLLAIIVSYVEDNITNTQLSVEEISQQVHVSRATLYRKILRITGETPVEFIRSVKLQNARILLEKSGLPITQVAYMAGFSTPHYFSKAFKEKFGASPSEYISNYRKITVDTLQERPPDIY